VAWPSRPRRLHHLDRVARPLQPFVASGSSFSSASSASYMTRSPGPDLTSSCRPRRSAYVVVALPQPLLLQRTPLHLSLGRHSPHRLRRRLRRRRPLPHPNTHPATPDLEFMDSDAGRYEPNKSDAHLLASLLDRHPWCRGPAITGEVLIAAAMRRLATSTFSAISWYPADTSARRGGSLQPTLLGREHSAWPSNFFAML